LAFLFCRQYCVSSAGFWRFLESNRILIVSLHNGHQFGQAKPIDLLECVAKKLMGKVLTEIKKNKDTGDLALQISDVIQIQIFIASAGYETYEFRIGDKRCIGFGSGDIEIVEGTDNPQIFRSRLP
jgi:hypothetical protein